jgi:hypothetical protein
MRGVTTNTMGNAQRKAARAVAITTLLGASGLFAASCKDGGSATPAPSASAPEAPASVGTAAPRASTESGGDDLRPVYPIDNSPPLPLAESYCAAVRETPKKRREACCPGLSTFAPTSECVRTLSAALRSGAVALETADVDACTAAANRETTGCDWVTSVESKTPRACAGIIKGKLKDGARCRSNLECEEGLRCRALGATRAGKCSAPLPSQRVCNISTDTLAALTGQDDLDRHHPECEGYCMSRQCTAAKALGAACVASPECGPKARCIAGKCSDAPAPPVGKPCTDECADGARCVKGTCLAPKGGGQSCELDAECLGHCERHDGGATGQCAADCPSFPTTPAKPASK